MGAQPDDSTGSMPTGRRRTVDTLREQYHSEVSRALVEDPRSGEYLPQVLVRVCVGVLPIDGAGLSLTDQLRIPLSASSPAVAEAERLQTSLGEGPCLTATAESQPVVADADQLARRWPIFASEIRRRTPFRSVAALPLLPVDGGWLGAVDLYSTDPSAPFGSLEDIRVAVAAPMMSFLQGDHDWSSSLIKPIVNRTAPDRRMRVWTAVGLLMAEAEADDNDALALLRAFTFRHELDLETAAELVISRTVPAEAVLDGDVPDL
jgi:hypothetical protein